jgi:hypothetical protein
MNSSSDGLRRTIVHFLDPEFLNKGAGGRVIKPVSYYVFYSKRSPTVVHIFFSTYFTFFDFN